MMSSVSPNHVWMTPIAHTLETHGFRGNFLIALQTYRPRAVRMIADEFNMAFCDFRATYMAPKGMKAGSVSLHQLDQFLDDERSERGLVLHNVEALLATKSKHKQSKWLSDFVQKSSRHPILVPLSLYFTRAPIGCDRVVWIDPTNVPQETLLVALVRR